MRPQANFRHTPHEDRGPRSTGSSTEGPPTPHFGTPLTRIVALAACGAHPEVLVAGPACGPRPNFGTPLTRIVALAPYGVLPKAHRSLTAAHPSREGCPDPMRSFSEGPSGGARMRPQAQFRHTPHEDRGPGPIGSSTERPFWRTPHEDRCPDHLRSSSEGPSGRARVRPEA